MILAGEQRDASSRVLRSSVEARTRTNALGRRNREENPAARIKICGVGRGATFIDIILT